MLLLTYAINSYKLETELLRYANFILHRFTSIPKDKCLFSIIPVLIYLKRVIKVFLQYDVCKNLITKYNDRNNTTA